MPSLPERELVDTMVTNQMLGMSVVAMETHPMIAREGFVGAAYRHREYTL